MTNFDKIKQMSAEEFAQKHSNCDMCVHGEAYTCKKGGECWVHVLEWLNKECKKDD